MTATRLTIYNDALLLAGERALASLSENREPRYLLDQVWTNDGVIACLEAGQWNFAMRTVRLDYDPAISPQYGYRRAFDKPTDWVLTSSLCSDEYFRVPLTSYVDEAGLWYCDLDTIYYRYVSSDTNYGLNLSGWPRTFTEFVAAHFAAKIVLKISNDEARLKTILAIREKLLLEAKNKALMSGPTLFPARGNWSQSRNRWGARTDRGNSGSLIG